MCVIKVKHYTPKKYLAYGSYTKRYINDKMIIIIKYVVLFIVHCPFHEFLIRIKEWLE